MTSTDPTASHPVPILPSGTSPCPDCAGRDADLRAVVANLGRKYTDLGQILGEFIRASSGDAASAVETRRATSPRSLADLAERAIRIVGGVETQPGDYPECALIGHRSPNGAESWFCTGVLVHPRVVLTAAHCQGPRAPINVVALDAQNHTDLGAAELVDVKRTEVHPRYRRTPGNDIAVLVLRSDARTTPSGVATDADLAAASTTTLVGFGNSDPLSTRGFGIQREVTVDITGLRRGPEDDLDAEEQRWGFESDREFVAGGQGFDSCNGDSGGPAYVVDSEGTRRAAGLTSRATRGALRPCGDGGIYTRIDTQAEFIADVLARAGITDRIV